MKVSGKNFLNIQGWMRTELNLKGNELLVYAIIYGFTQDGESFFTGSAQYIADWLGATKKTARTILNALAERGLLEKKDVMENSVKFCHYRVKNFPGVGKNLPHGGEKISPGGGEKISPYNKYINNKEENNNKKRVSVTKNRASNVMNDNVEKERESASRFARPSLEEVKAYCEERGNSIDPEHFIDYYEANGWKVGKNSMKDWKAAVRNWEKRDGGFSPKKPKEEPEDNAWWADL